MAKLSDSAKQRLEEKFANSDFFVGPEDLAREVAKALGLDNVPGQKVPAAESPTRGDVPPFSGTTDVADENATAETKKLLKKRAEVVAKKEKAAAEANNDTSVTREEIAGPKGTEADQETEVKEK